MNNYTGKQIGQYIVIGKCAEKTNDGHSLYNCKCIKCGYIRTSVRIESLKYINPLCNHVEIKCNWSNKKLEQIFNGMKSRCYNKDSKYYKWYGAKGISICKEWLNNPQNFNNWSIDNGYKDKLSIDRIDGNKDYCPENCRWITLEDNAKYKSTTNIIEVNGILDSGRGWSKKIGFGPNYINTYIRKHGIDEAISFIRKKIS